MGFGALAKGGLQSKIGFSESADFCGEAGKFGRVGAHAVGERGFAEILKTGKFADATSDFYDREAAERKAGCADARGVDAGAEEGIGEHGIEDGGQITGAFPPDRKSLDGVGLERVIAGMIYCGGDVAV